MAETQWRPALPQLVSSTSRLLHCDAPACFLFLCLPSTLLNLLHTYCCHLVLARLLLANHSCTLYCPSFIPSPTLPHSVSVRAHRPTNMNALQLQKYGISKNCLAQSSLRILTLFAAAAGSSPSFNRATSSLSKTHSGGWMSMTRVIWMRPLPSRGPSSQRDSHMMLSARR